MKTWIDACTGKQVRYASAIADRLRSLGHQPILTTREHLDTLALADMIGEKFRVVGKYDSTSLVTRARESVRRSLLFCEMFGEDPPDLAVSHQSVEACRVAFGLGVPIVSTADAPHAEAVNKLTLPLVNVLITSRAIPRRCYRGYGVKKVVQFDGVDEVAWIKGYKPKLGTEEYGKPLIVVRQMETGASYARGKMDVTEEIARKLSRLGQVIFLPRYDRCPREGLVVLEKFVNSLSLAAEADLVVSVGGTIAREAALQGTPSIVIPALLEPKFYYTNNYLTRLGFPLFTVDVSEAMKLARRHLGVKWDVKERLERLQNPVDVVERIVKGGEYD